ncbi:MAG: carboxypeptidase-like regulatory domain-containing protein [Flavobacteriaceae bacterium]|nr:carboxypeptidase-like regulatory domain-containing protein [Flavobacteriaceae bacterium]
MKNKNWILILLIIPVFLYSQNDEISIEGLILDNTGYGIPYAAIGIPSKYIGSSTNEDGVFLFTLSKSNLVDTLEVSSIGYKTFKINVQDYINQKEKKMVLIEDIVSLSEVNILASKDYVKLALKNYKKNVVSDMHQLNALYRRFSSEANTSRFLVEHYIKILDMNPLDLELYEIEVEQTRKSVDYRFIKKKQKFHAVELLSKEHPIRQGLYKGDYVWKKTGDSSYDGEDIVVIEGEKKDQSSGGHKFVKFYIGIDTYSIYKIESSLKNSVFIYKKNNAGKLYLSYHNRASESKEPLTPYMQKLLKVNTNTLTATWRHEVIVLGIETDRKKIDVENNMVKGLDMGDYNIPYNQEFWSKLNLPPASKFYNKYAEELESIYGIPLNKQFGVSN